MKTASQIPCASTGFAVPPGWPGLRATDKSVRDLSVIAKLKDGDVIVTAKRCGVIFGFPLAVWPATWWEQAQWIERLTPWWDMHLADWTPQAQRLRDSCRAAINKLSAPTQNRGSLATDADARETPGECVGAGHFHSANDQSETRRDDAPKSQ